ncbi:MAG: SGNH/GDSL hydrolase family protein [Clostridia bacterium]|nr:SGNH/GDSL hydrolase family protein [Clostridia bacterium]
MEKKTVRLMFTGDSVTDCSRARPIGDGAGSVGDSYVATLFTRTWAEHPGHKIRFLNTATSGDTTEALLKRFDSEVLEYSPDCLFIMIGINDCWRYFDDNMLKAEYHIPADKSAENVEEMIKKTKASGASVVLISPLFFDTNKDDPMRQMRDVLDEKFKAIAEKYSVEYIDVQQNVDEYLKVSSSYVLSGDRVHPKAIGKALIAGVIYDHPAFKALLK